MRPSRSVVWMFWFSDATLPEINALGALMRIAWYAAAIGVLGAAVLHPAHSFAQTEPVINWSPTNPEIGETVVFAIEGVSVDIKKAYWNMGGPGCDGTDSTPTCIPTLWNNCKTQAYRYSSSGTKTVSLSIEVGGDTFITFIAPPVQVSVALSGSCPGDPIFADGFESGDLWAWSSSQPPPPPCVHDACDTGVALDPQCDPCVAQICAVDDFCCTVYWDRPCVDQVASVCGLTCN